MRFIIHASVALCAITVFDSTMGPWAMAALFFGVFVVMAVIAGFLRSSPKEVKADSCVMYEGATGHSLFAVNNVTPQRYPQTSKANKLALGVNTPALEGE